MEHLKTFVVTLTTISVFVVAVELVLPDNKLKKYQEFALSLIVLSVILTPIVKIFTGNNVKADIELAIDNTFNKDKESFYESETSNSFIITRLEENCKNLLEEKFTDNKFKVSIDANINLDVINMNINEVNIKVLEKTTSSKVKDVDKVVIGQEQSEEGYEDIKKTIAQELNIDEDIINIVKG